LPQQRASSNPEDSFDEDRSSHIKPVPSLDKKTSDKKGLQPATKQRKSEEKKDQEKKKLPKRKAKILDKRLSHSSKLKLEVHDDGKEVSNLDTTPATQTYMAPENEA